MANIFSTRSRTQTIARRLQLLESHRIGSPDPNAPDAPDGIGVDAVGAPVFYRVVQDDGSTIDVPANLMLHVFEPEDASAVRCAPTYQHSINHILDEMDLLALEKHAVKDNADIARIIKRANEGDLNDEQDFSLTPRGNPPGPRRKDKDGKPLDGFDDEDEFGRSDPINLQRIIGGKVVSLAPGEDVDTFVSNRPSPTFTGFPRTFAPGRRARCRSVRVRGGFQRHWRRRRAPGGGESRPAF